MLNNKTASAAGVLLGLALASDTVAQNSCTLTTEVEGNTTSEICLRTLDGAERTFSYQFYGNSYFWKLNSGALTNSPGGGSIAVTNTSDPLRQQYMLTTSGLPITGSTPSSARYVQFIFCYKPFLTISCDSINPQEIKFKVDPIVRLSRTTNITTNGQTPITVTLGAPNHNPTPGAEIAATCTQANGATVSVSPATQTTGSNGSTPPFVITTSGLHVYAPPPGNDPSGSCTFRTVAGTKSATINVKGSRIFTTLTASPTTAGLPPGNPNYTQRVTVSTNPIAASVPINVTCAGSTSSVVVSPATATLTTDETWGTASLDVEARNMVTVYPAAPPTAQCSFTLGTLQPATYTINGVALGQNVVVDPSSFSSLNWTGKAPVVASLSAPYPGYTIASSCSSSRPDIAVWTSPTSIATNTAGKATFEINAPMLGYADPNLSAAPIVSCKFWFVPGFESPVYLPTSNACSPSSLSPMPAVCGNPQ